MQGRIEYGRIEYVLAKCNQIWDQNNPYILTFNITNFIYAITFNNCSKYNKAKRTFWTPIVYNSKQILRRHEVKWLITL